MLLGKLGVEHLAHGLLLLIEQVDLHLLLLQHVSLLFGRGRHRFGTLRAHPAHLVLNLSGLESVLVDIRNSLSLLVDILLGDLLVHGSGLLSLLILFIERLSVFVLIILVAGLAVHTNRLFIFDLRFVVFHVYHFVSLFAWIVVFFVVVWHDVLELIAVHVSSYVESLL